jgi:hypothetical protein
MKPKLFGIVLALICSLTVAGGEIQAADNSDATTGAIEVTPSVNGVFVDGDDNKFREDWWMREGLNGGVENFSLRRELGADTTIEAQGRAIVPEENYRLGLLIDKRDVGYIRAGYSEYRKYFDDTGGFFLPFSESSFDLSKDLHLDIGKVFIEAGLLLPNMPKLIVGYEHRFKDGEKSLLEWGSVTEDVTRKIFPSFKDIDEKVDIVRLEVSHDIANVHLGDEFRYEYYRVDTKRHAQDIEIGDPTGTETVTVDEDYEHDAFYNTLHAETHLNDTTFLSLGYLYTTLDGDASFRMMTIPFGPEIRDKNWFTNSIDLDQDVHIVNANVILGPFRALTIYAGIQGESQEVDGDTDAILTESGEGSPEALIDSEKDKWGVEETVGIRYAGLPRTTLYAEGRWTQQDIDLTEREIEDGVLAFERDTDTRVRRQRYSIGFNSSPLPRTTVAARYRYGYRSNDYDHNVDSEPTGYSAFILDQDIKTDEVMAKVSFQPFPRIRTSLQYQLVVMDIDTDEDTDPPSSPRTTDYDADIYTASLTATPYAGLFLTGLVSYQDVHLETVVLPDAPINTYDGDVLSVSAAAGLALDSRTNLNVQYIYTLAENFEDFSDDGMPLGVENQRHAVIANLSRRITDMLSVRLRYGFYSYDDDASDRSDDYTAHLVGAALSMTF